jgi:hypothetical protein
VPARSARGGGASCGPPATRGGEEGAARDAGAPGGLALLRESTSSTNRGRGHWRRRAARRRCKGGTARARLRPRGGGGGLNRTGHLLACGPRLGRRVQGGDGGGAVESGLGTPEVGDDSVGPSVSDRERRGPVGLYWAASESGLRPTAVGGEGDKGARADFRGQAWPK